MGPNQKLSLIQPLVMHLLAQQDLAGWRRELADAGVMELEEAMALSPEAMTAAYRTLKTLQFMQQHPDQIMNAIDEHNVCWQVDLDYDYRHGVICY